MAVADNGCRVEMQKITQFPRVADSLAEFATPNRFPRSGGGGRAGGQSGADRLVDGD